LGLENVGVLLFKNIFEIAPGALQLFSFKDEANLYESAKLKKHGLRVVSTVGTAVEKLGQPDELVPVLKALGLRHVGYGVQPAHYEVVGQALLQTLRTGLGSDFTPAVEAAWTKVWGFVVKCTIPEEVPTPAPAEPGALSDSERALVTATWGKATGLGLENVGVLLFKNIFEIAPGALQLFSFKDEANLYESAKLKKHGLRVVSTVGTAVEKLGQPDELVPVLKALGLRHVGYGVQPAHYEVVGQALLQTLRTGLGSDFTPAVEAAWTKVWGFVAKCMLREDVPTPAPLEPGALFESERALVKETWGKAAGLGAESVGVLLFKSVFEIAPGALQLFSFKDEPNLCESVKFKKHAVRVIAVVSSSVRSLDRPEAIVPILKELGLRHVAYNVVLEHYEVVGRALIRTLQTALGASFTSAVDAAWTKFWGVVAQSMIPEE